MPVFENDAALRQTLSAGRNQMIQDEQGRLLSVDDYGNVQYYNSSGEPISGTEASLPSYKQSSLWKSAENILTLGGKLDVSLQNRAGDAPYPIAEGILDFIVEGASMGIINPDPRGFNRAQINAVSKVWNAVGLNKVVGYEDINRTVGRATWGIPAIALGAGGGAAIAGAAEGVGVPAGAASVIGAGAAGAGKQAFLNLATTGKIDTKDVLTSGAVGALGSALNQPAIRQGAVSTVQSLSAAIRPSKRARDGEEMVTSIAEQPASKTASFWAPKLDAAGMPDIVSLEPDRQTQYVATTVTGAPTLAGLADREGSVAARIFDDVANSSARVEVTPRGDILAERYHLPGKMPAFIEDSLIIQTATPSSDVLRRDGALSRNNNGTATFSQANARVQLVAENDIATRPTTLDRVSARQVGVNLSLEQRTALQILGENQPMYNWRDFVQLQDIIENPKSSGSSMQHEYADDLMKMARTRLNKRNKSS
jgi:hypothetical protein